jgi:hypothetical protein
LFKGYGIHCYGVRGTISNCYFKGTNGYVIYDVAAVTVEDNIIEDNNCNNNPCIYSQVYSYSAEFEVRPIHRNELYRNNGANIVQYHSSYGVAIFSNNTLFNNTVNNPATEAPLLFNEFIEAQYNYFANPACTYEVIVVTPSSQPSQNLTLNYWGSSDEREVIDKIYDFADDSTKARVLYLPYLMSMDPNDLSPNETTLTFIGPNSTIAGDMTEDVHLPIEHSPYTATGTIVVDEGLTLSIDPGVIIRFKTSASNNKFSFNQYLIKFF